METQARLLKIEEQIAALPKGNITYKTIRGKERMYLQWSENGRLQSKYIKLVDQPIVIAQIEKRKALEAERAKVLVNDKRKNDGQQEYCTNVKTGVELELACRKVSRYQSRACIKILINYLQSDTLGRVCLVYGLRRTGKTTMVLQAIATLPKDKTAYIKVMASDDMAKLNKDLKLLSEQGIKYVFIDEVTLLEDFIESASLFSDVYAMFGMKIVLSGTDSLGFAIAAQEELYNRCVTIHTTFIPFKEYSRLLGIHDIDEYIRYGGTLRAGEVAFDDEELLDEAVSFRDDESTRRYIDTAIAKNIQHSLACYENGGHFRHLVDLYECNELTNAINRIIEDMNHRFLLSVLTRNVKSHDLGSVTQLERKQAAKENSISVLDIIDKQVVTERLMEILDICNQENLSVALTQQHIKEIKEYLKRLDLILDYPYDCLGGKVEQGNVLFAQPGMRYCQAQALVHVLLKDDVFKKYDIVKRNAICERLLQEVRGRLLEEIVLLETIKALPKNFSAFKLYFDIGEFDMVIFDRKNISCKIFEIKHTDTIDERQYKNLIDAEKCSFTEFEYGPIQERIVLYRGEEIYFNGIHYMNVTEYLEGL